MNTTRQNIYNKGRELEEFRDNVRNRKNKQNKTENLKEIN